MASREELQARMDEMARAYAGRDATGCAALFAPHGELHSPYAPPARGRTEIEALHRTWTAEAVHKDLRVLDAGGSDDLAWALSAYTEGTPDSEGTSLCVFERGNGGEWLIRMCCLHGNHR